MQRSRGQIATAYAPHSLFTFEGGAGACMAMSAANRSADLSNITARLIGEQIQEYFEAWADRAGRGANLAHPVPPALAVDSRALSEGVVRVRVGELAFQVRTRLAIYRSRCRSPARVAVSTAKAGVSTGWRRTRSASATLARPVRPDARTTGSRSTWC